jgi:uncharacterized protein YcbX
MMAAVRVEQLWRFPVKSLLGESVPEVEVTERGVLGDRAWALVDAEDGKVVSAKNPRKWARCLELSAAYVDAPVAGAEAPPVAVSLPDGTTVRSDAAGTDAALSSFLGRDVRLTSVAPPVVRFEETWPDVDGLAPEGFIASTRIDTGHDDEVVSDIQLAMAAPPGTFFDLATLHLLTTSTLDALRAASPEGTFDVRRYRPNVLVATDETGYVENAWVGRRLALGDGGAAMQGSMPTMRCIMTTLAQGDLPKDPSLLRTVAAENRLEIGGGRWACAGLYGDVAATGTVRVGDPVTLS